MLVLFHLFSGVPVGDLAGMDAVVEDAGAGRLPQLRRVVLAGQQDLA